MLRRPGISLRLGLTPQALTLVRINRWPTPSVEIIAEQALGDRDVNEPITLTAALRQVLVPEKCAGLTLTVVLTDSLVRIWQVTPPESASRFSDLTAAAHLRFLHLYGESLDGWKATADWNVNSPFLAAAIPLALVEALLGAAAMAGCTVASISPQFIHAWNRWRKELEPQDWFGLVQDGALTFGVGSAGRLSAIRVVELAPRPDLAWLKSQADREALRLNIDSPTVVRVCGQVPSEWSDAVAVDAFQCVDLERVERTESAFPIGAVLACTGVGR